MGFRTFSMNVVCLAVKRVKKEPTGGGTRNGNSREKKTAEKWIEASYDDWKKNIVYSCWSIISVGMTVGCLLSYIN